MVLGWLSQKQPEERDEISALDHLWVGGARLFGVLTPGVIRGFGGLVSPWHQEDIIPSRLN